MLPDFQLVRPTSLDEALDAIDDERIPVCGGTELLLAMKMGMLVPEALVDISRIDALKQLDVDGSHMVIGGAVTHRHIGANADVRKHLPMLGDVEDAVGNARVRAQGTIAGNLCFAEPKSDVATALLVYDAEIVLASADGSRTVPMTEFIEGPYTTVRDDSELLVEIRIPMRDGRRATYLKFQTMERPTIGVAASVDDDRVRVAVGAVGPVPVFADYGSFSEVDVDAIVGEVEPLPDLTGSEDYKRHVTDLYVRRALEALR